MQNMYNVHICIYILYCGVWSREEYRIPQNPRPENVASVERICQAPEICLSLQIFQTSIASWSNNAIIYLITKESTPEISHFSHFGAPAFWPLQFPRSTWRMPQTTARVYNANVDSSVQMPTLWTLQLNEKMFRRLILTLMKPWQKNVTYIELPPFHSFPWASAILSSKKSLVVTRILDILSGYGNRRKFGIQRRCQYRCKTIQWWFFFGREPSTFLRFLYGTESWWL